MKSLEKDQMVIVDEIEKTIFQLKLSAKTIQKVNHKDFFIIEYNRAINEMESLLKLNEMILFRIQTIGK